MRRNHGTGAIIVVVIGVITACCLTTSVWADVPHMINYQGRLTDSSGVALDTTISMQFYIYNASFLGTQLWTESHSAVEVENGLFNVILGSVSPIGTHIFTGDNRWLAIAIGGDPIAKPRQRIVSQAYSYHAKHADTTEYALDAKHADTAEYALNSVGGTGGWLDSGTRVRLVSSGDSVGIGTSTPSEKFHLNGHLMLSDDFDIKFGTSGSILEQSSTDLVLRPADDLHLSPADNIYIRQGTGATFMTIDPGSRTLGMGTTTPEDMFHIVNDVSGGSAFLRVEAAHETNWHEAGVRIETPQNRWHLRMDDDSNNQIPDGALGLRSQDAAMEVMTWNEDGNVGIGATNPTHRITVNGAIGIQESGTTRFHLKHVSGGLNFAETGVADYRLFLQNGGDVGIGEDNPQEKLHVDGNVRVDGTVMAEGFEDNTIDRYDIIDEVGLASATALATSDLTVSWTSYLSKVILVPSAGYILALGSAYCWTDHGADGHSKPMIVVSDSPNDSEGGTTAKFYLAENVAPGEYGCSIRCRRLFFVDSAGGYTYYLLGRRDDPFDATIASKQLDLLFIPTAYGVGTLADGSDADQQATLAALHAARNELESEKRVPGDYEVRVAHLENQLNKLMTEMEALRHRIETTEGK